MTVVNADGDAAAQSLDVGASGIIVLVTPLGIAGEIDISGAIKKSNGAAIAVQFSVMARFTPWGLEVRKRWPSNLKRLGT